MYETLFPYLLGVMLAWITWRGARLLKPPAEQKFFSLIITIVALGFVGFPLEDGDLIGFTYEAIALIFFLVLIALGKHLALLCLPVVWIAHGAWDLAYLLGHVPVDKPDWVVQLCVPYDWLLAGYIISRLPTWASERNLSK
jgi:hypothetical protein